MQVPILSGVYTRTGPDFERSYPLNMVPNVEETGISNGYLKQAPGVRQIATGVGDDGGGYVWNGTHYRASGGSLVSLAADGTLTTIGTITSGPAIFAESFDRLAIAIGRRLFYLIDGAVTEVTDPDLGPVVDMTWMDGYFVTTDGTSIVVTELNDPTAVDPLKYGSAEESPDAVIGLLRLRSELYVLGRYTIEVMRDTGTTGFPFAPSRGAQIPKGVVGTYAKCPFVETFAFCGSARNEQCGVYLAGAGQAVKISNKALDVALAALTEDELAQVALEARQGAGIQDLFVHLPNQTFVYSYNASQALDLPVWYRLAAGLDASRAYRARNMVLANGQWICGDIRTGAIGVVDASISAVFGEAAGWQFDSAMIYNEGHGAICHNLELVGNYGRAAFGEDPRVMMSWTDDGRTYSQERSSKVGVTGARNTRLAWRKNGHFRQWRSFRFRGVTASPVSFSRLNADLEALNG